MLPSCYHIPAQAQSKRDWASLIEARGNVFSFRQNAPVEMYPYYVSYDGPRTIAPHFHGFLEIELVLSGTSIVHIGGREHRARTGDLFFLNDLEEHREIITAARMEKLIIGFLPKVIDDALTGSTADDLLGAFLLARPFSVKAGIVHFPDDALARITNAWLSLIHEFSAARHDRIFHLSTQFRSLLSLIISTAGLAAKSESPMAPVFDYLAAHIAEPTNVAKAITYSGLSKSHFYRLFQRASGMPVTAYVNQVRVEKAKRLLSATTLPIPRIAAELGFTDAAYFHRVFKRIAGMTPEALRRAEAIRRSAATPMP
ncbi:MAG: AraC family transcriptional regulator [Spirochaetota bacterium]